MNLSKAQRKVLENLNRTAFYGQNQRTFDALLNKGMIRWETPDEYEAHKPNRFQLTDLGHENLR